MLFAYLANTPRDYAWGSTTAISEFLGRTPSGSPEAELWFGAHAGSPSVVLSDDAAYCNLATLIATNPELALGPAIAETRGGASLPVEVAGG